MKRVLIHYYNLKLFRVTCVCFKINLNLYFFWLRRKSATILPFFLINILTVVGLHKYLNLYKTNAQTDFKF